VAFGHSHPRLHQLSSRIALYVGNMKSVGRIDQQTFVDTYSKAVCAKLYDRKTLLTPASLLNSCCRCSSSTRSSCCAC